jgi:hypothetical protein
MYGNDDDTAGQAHQTVGDPPNQIKDSFAIFFNDVWLQWPCKHWLQITLFVT